MRILYLGDGEDLWGFALAGAGTRRCVTAAEVRAAVGAAVGTADGGGLAAVLVSPEVAARAGPLLSALGQGPQAPVVLVMPPGEETP